MSFYQFKEEDAYRFARFKNAYTTRRGDELQFRICPYCEKDSKEDRNKFSINLKTGQFQCFRGSCGRKGNMISLAQDFDFSLSDDVDKYINRRGINDKYKRFKDPKREIEVRSGAVEYLQSRGISEEVCKKYEITTRPDDNKILVFPFKNPEGELKFVKYRNTQYIKGETGGSKEWCESNCMPILFGMNQCTSSGTLVITEGQMDSLSCAEAGIENAVSVPMGMNAFTWLPYCWKWMQHYQKIVVFGDHEKGYITLADPIKARFPKITAVVKPEDYKGCKDANEILRTYGKEAIIHAVENAEYQASKRLKDMATVRRVDIEKVETIKTNISSLDKILTGGFKIGSVNLISGKRGNGKSTLGSEFVVEALAQDYNCFIYSGELPDFYVKAWMDRQIIGKKELYNSDISECEEWYKERLWIYDNRALPEDGEEMEGLIETVEEAIIHKNCRLILLDNLMTALSECNTNDQLYMAQSNFLGKLVRLAQIYEVIILLVAHPRKGGQEFQNDDVSGSADITNKVDTVMSYDKIEDKKDPDYDREEVRVLRVTKNRLTGKLGKIKLYYSEDSKRINDSENFIRHYLPEEEQGFVDPDEEEEVPW